MTRAIRRKLLIRLGACTLLSAATPAGATATGDTWMRWSLETRAAYVLGYTAGHNDAVVAVVTSTAATTEAVRDAADAAIQAFPCVYERDADQVAAAVSLYIGNRPSRHHERLNHLLGEALREWCAPFESER